MQFNDTTNDTGIAQMIDGLCTTNSLSFPIEDKARAANNYYDLIFITQVLQAGSRQADDSNYTILPEKTLAFESGDRQITLPNDLLFVDHIEMTDKNGNYKDVTRVDKASQNTVWQSGATGEPTFFDEQGDFIVFDKTPDYSGTIRLWYTRDVDPFTASDTTKTPGIARVLHQYIAYGVAIEYCNINSQERVPLMEKRLGQLEIIAKRLVGKAQRRVRARTEPKSSFK